MYIATSTSVISFLWGGISGVLVPAVLVKTGSQKACAVVAGVRDLAAMNIASLFLQGVTHPQGYLNLLHPLLLMLCLMEIWLPLLASYFCLISIAQTLSKLLQGRSLGRRQRR